MAEAKRVTADGFVLGVINCADAIERPFWIDRRNRKLNRAFEAAYTELKEKTDNDTLPGVELTFVVKPHPVHGDSQPIHDSLASLIWGSRFIKLQDYARPGSSLGRLDRRGHEDPRDFHDTYSFAIDLDFEVCDSLARTFLDELHTQQP